MLLASAGAAVVIAYALLRGGIPGEGEQIALVVLGLAGAAAPPVILLVFLLALRELIELPERVRALPDTGRDRAAELARLAREAHARRAVTGLPFLLWRFGRLIGSARELLTPWAPLLPLLSMPFLLLTAAAAAAAVLEVAVALVALAVLFA